MPENQATGPIFDFQLEDIWPILLTQRAVIGLFMTTILVATLVFGLIKTKQYTASVLTPLQVLREVEPSSGELLDLALLQIETQVRCNPPRSRGKAEMTVADAMGYRGGLTGHPGLHWQAMQAMLGGWQRHWQYGVRFIEECEPEWC